MNARFPRFHEFFRALSIGPVERRLMGLSIIFNEVRTRFLQTAQIAGVSAAVTVLLGAPLTSAFFATEVMYRDRLLFEKLFYGLLASLSAYAVTVMAIGRPVLFHIEVFPKPARASATACI